MAKPELNEVLEIIRMKEEAAKLYEQIDANLAEMIFKFGAGRFDYDVSDIEGQETDYLKFELKDNLQELATKGYIFKSTAIKPVSFCASGLKNKPKSLK